MAPLPSPLHTALWHWLTNQPLTPVECALLEQTLRLDGAPWPSSTPLATALPQRLALLADLYEDYQHLCSDRLQWHEAPLEPLWRVWLPLALTLSGWQQQAGRCLIQGILGGQGTGKTTLALILSLILQRLGHRVGCVSLDDLYLTYEERCHLQERDRRLQWRGPPGTHDLELGLATLNRLRHATPTDLIPIPRFDKSLHGGAGDRVAPEWVQAVDIVLFEGWFVGVQPVHPQQFDTAPPPILTESDRAFARDCNSRLHAYLPLWELLDRLIILYPVDYRLSQSWRRLAEQRMRQEGRSGMDDAAIDRFVEYFWRSLHPDLFITPLLREPAVTDLIIEINSDHSPGRVFRPHNKISGL